jgi:uncharacterized membrane protein YcaP (DUF421 family)
MKNLVNLVIKLAFTYLVLFIMIPMLGKGTWTQTIVLGLVLGLLSYILGDMWILPKFGTIAAVIADLGLSALVIWLMMKGLPHFVLTSGGVWAIAAVLAIGEWLFHRYLLATKAPNK